MRNLPQHARASDPFIDTSLSSTPNPVTVLFLILSHFFIFIIPITTILQEVIRNRFLRRHPPAILGCSFENPIPSTRSISVSFFEHA